MSSSGSAIQVVWFKKDLRVKDHAPLCEAAKRGSLLPLWVEEPEWLAADDFDERHRRFAVECLQELDQDLQAMGLRLLAMKGSMLDCLQQLHDQLGAFQLWSHEETGNDWTYQRDIDVGDWCKHNNITWNEIPQTGVVRRLGNRDGWSARWLHRMKQPVLTESESVKAASFPNELHDDSAMQCVGEPHPLRQRGGRREGIKTLESFFYERGVDYTKAMSSPVTAYDACSRISPYLTWGAVSVREAWHATQWRRAEVKDLIADGKPVERKWLQAIKSFDARLRWHCHFMQKLEDAPSIEWENLQRASIKLDRRDPDWDDPDFKAWREGRTGFPMIDACMRALDVTGYLNFRMRAMVMSFASHHLWLHWRKPGLHLAKMFTDYEPGIHWPQVQMQSGTTGINTVRVYSPIKQLHDQDPKGEFVRRWVPELKDVPDNYLAQPETMPEMEQGFCNCIIGKDYPAPIVDHPTAYRRAHDQIRALRRESKSRQQAQEIQQRHGSRKQGQRNWR